MTRQWLAGLLTLVLASCATVPAPLRGDFSTLSPREAVDQDVSDARVRWGGEIIQVQPKASTTCFEVLSRDLALDARPLLRDPAGGRFIACHAGFHDPEVFERGRLITIVGRVTGTDVAKVGEFDYHYPHVDADTIYLWPPRSQYAPPPWPDPWLHGYPPGWYPPGWGPYWTPYWSGGVIIRTTPRHR